MLILLGMAEEDVQFARFGHGDFPKYRMMTRL